MAKFTHFDSEGNTHMVDVGNKADTKRIAVVKGHVKMQPETLAMITDGSAKKGDVLGVARLAGIMGAKQTSTLIPLCHNITLDSSEIKFRILEEELQIVSIVQSEEKTGVEMEALTAVTISALAIYDMVKGVDKSVYIKEIFLLEKKGGKTGDYTDKNDRKK